MKIAVTFENGVANIDITDWGFTTAPKVIAQLMYSAGESVTGCYVKSNTLITLYCYKGTAAVYGDFWVSFIAIGN